jgi:glycosyltransferase involved in cell wall biosynthesis
MTSTKPAILVILAADYDSARAKGVEHLFREYDEDGFFRKAILVSPYFRRDRRLALDDTHELHEFGFGSRLFKALVLPLHVLRVIRACRRLVRQEGVRIIRATEPTLCGFVAWTTSRLTGIPYCVSLHADYDKLFELDGRRGAPTVLGSRALIRPLEKLTLRGAVRVLPIRASLVPYAVNRGVQRDNIRVIPHGVDLAPFAKEPVLDIRKALDLPPAMKVVAFAGRLSPENYVMEVLEAVAILARRRRDFVLVLAGGGVLEREVAERLVHDPLLNGVVRKLGFVARDTIVSLRRTCTVSICLMGGFSLIEACAGGRPVISYDVDWHHELIVDGETGRLLPEHSVAAVVAALDELLDAPEKASSMGATGRDRAFARHDIRAAAKTRQRWYQEILDQEAA